MSGMDGVPIVLTFRQKVKASVKILEGCRDSDFDVLRIPRDMHGFDFLLLGETLDFGSMELPKAVRCIMFHKCLAALVDNLLAFRMIVTRLQYSMSGSSGPYESNKAVLSRFGLLFLRFPSFVQMLVFAVLFFFSSVFIFVRRYKWVVGFLSASFSFIGWWRGFELSTSLVSASLFLALFVAAVINWLSADTLND